MIVPVCLLLALAAPAAAKTTHYGQDGKVLPKVSLVRQLDV
jgi:hypothetical protein